MKYPISQLDFQRDFTSFIELSQAIYGERAVTDQALYQWLFADNIYNPNGNHLFHVARDGDKRSEERRVGKETGTRSLLLTVCYQYLCSLTARGIWRLGPSRP